MTSTGLTLDAATAARFVDGHDARGKVTSRFDMSVLAGAGGLRSSVNDMLKFVAANLDPQGTELHQAMASAQEPRTPTDVAAQEIALGWNVDERSGDTIIWHGGATGGSSPTSPSTRFITRPRSSSATRAPRTSTTSASTSSTPPSRCFPHRPSAPKPPCPPPRQLRR